MDWMSIRGEKDYMRKNERIEFSDVTLNHCTVESIRELKTPAVALLKTEVTE